MSRKAGSLSIVLIATATVSLMLAGTPSAQYGAGDTQKSTQKPSTSTQKPAPTSTGAPHDAHAASGMVSPADKKFLTDMAQGGEAEVEIARMAQQKAASADVKSFAQRMETDHSKANSELQAIIANKKVTVPGGLGPHMALKNRLDKLQGAAFDQAYMKAMVENHSATVRKLEMESKTSKDADIKGFADKVLPTVQEHLKMAQETNKTVSSTMRSSTTTTGTHTGTAGAHQGTTGTSTTGTSTTGTSTTGTSTGSRRTK